MDITLTPEIEKYVQDKIASGRFASPSEVIAAALEACREEERLYAEELEELRRKIAVGIGELDRGEGEPWDVEKLIAEFNQEFARRKTHAQSS